MGVGVADGFGEVVRRVECLGGGRGLRCGCGRSAERDIERA